MKDIIKKILKLLTRRERKRLYLLFTAMVISGLIEVIGVVSLLPFLALVADSSLIEDNSYLKWLYENLNFQSSNSFLIFIGIIVLFVLIVSNVLKFFTQWGLLQFSWMRDYTLSKRLLNRYLHQPYLFFLDKNTTNLGKNILSETQAVIVGVVIPVIQVFSRSVVVIFIFAMLITVEPLFAISIVVVLGGLYIFIYKIIKNKLRDIGKRRFKTNEERFKAVNECFGDIKQLKLLGVEANFLDRYSKYSSVFAKYNATNQIISVAPRYIMEIFAFGSMIVLVLYLLASTEGLKEVLPMIGLFVFGTYRIMPSLQDIFKSVTQIRFYAPALNVLYDDMYSFKNDIHVLSSDKKRVRPLSFNNNIRLEKVTFTYPGSKTPIITNFNLKINVNTSIAFVGETGVGKTTIVDIILGLLRPSEGKIIVDDVEITDNNLSCWQRNLGYIPQDIYLQDDTVTRNIAFGIHDKDIDAEDVERAARIANIHNFVVKELPDKYATKIGERGVRLSGGQRQRIGIARALYHDPKVLVLDEATNALDGATEKTVFKAIDNIAKTKTLIIIAHRLNTIKNCDVVYALRKGKIIGEGKYEELLDSNEEFKKMAKAYL